MNKHITLEELLKSRDRRCIRQRELIEKYDSVLISFMVNMPGFVKVNETSIFLHRIGMSQLIKKIDETGLLCFQKEILTLSTGIEGYLAIDAPVEVVKRLTCDLENNLPYGRLLDFDVIDKKYQPVSRIKFGFTQRNCIVCGAIGPGCASRRLHPLEEVLIAVQKLAALCK